MIDNRLVGRRISTLRQANALTQQQLAALMNISHQAVSKWESGQTLPDIQTLIELTHFFGLTVEQLISENEPNLEKDEAKDDECVYESDVSADTAETETIQTDAKKEVKHMSIQQLLQMAPFMSKETVEEIVLEIEDRLTAIQIAKIAPYVRPECVEILMDRNKPELTWESLRRIAPFLSREYVDTLARSIACGKETVKPANDGLNKTINEIGKAFDDIGKGVEKAVKKAWRFGESVINEVSGVINDISNEANESEQPRTRSDRAVELRRRALERALADGKWDWIGSHIDELPPKDTLRGIIAAKAHVEGMEEWLEKYMGGYADAASIDAAIENGNWKWIGDHISQMTDDMQEKAALAAMNAGNWTWLECYVDQLFIKNCANQIATAAIANGADDFAALLAENHLTPVECAALGKHAVDVEKWELLARLVSLMESEAVEALAVQLAEKEKWQQVGLTLEFIGMETAEKLMEMAVEQGNFEAVDMLDAYL